MRLRKLLSGFLSLREVFLVAFLIKRGEKWRGERNSIYLLRRYIFSSKILEDAPINWFIVNPSTKNLVRGKSSPVFSSFFVKKGGPDISGKRFSGGK